MRRITVAEAQRQIGDRANKAVRALTLETMKRIVMRTPVDTGRARGNWNVGVGSPDRSTTEGTDRAGGGTIARGSAPIAAWQGTGSLFITNSLPYIIPLEDGHSSQAPAGMVKVTIAELQPLAREVAARIRHG
jgi:hypothetical protein